MKPDANNEPPANIGKPLPEEELLRMTRVTDEDIARAIDRFADAVPDNFSELLS